MNSFKIVSAWYGSECNSDKITSACSFFISL
jgi:hypothetical protein